LQVEQRESAVRVVRGEKCKTKEQLHCEIGAALQFPSYYGENWDALDECIADLDWLPAKWILVHITLIEDVLIGDDPQFKLFLEILIDAGRKWANPELRGLASTEELVKKPFNILISGNSDGLTRARKLIGEEV